VAGASSSLLPLLFWSVSPLMMKCHSVSSQPWLLSDPLSMLMLWSANAEVGKIAHAIISSVAAVTAMRPAAVSRLLWFVLRCAGIFPTSIVLTASTTGGHLCPPLAILVPLIGLLHPPKVPDCRRPFVLTCGSHPQAAQSVRAAAP